MKHFSYEDTKPYRAKLFVFKVTDYIEITAETQEEAEAKLEYMYYGNKDFKYELYEEGETI